VLNIDLAPTVLEMIAADGAQETQGVSLLPALQRRRRPKRSVFFYQYDRETPYSTPALMGVRTPEWKLVRYQEAGQAHELYNLRQDPHEMRNLYEASRWRQQRDRLDAELTRLAPLAKVPRPMR
jgi:arylsulfatase A-like enzyme